MKGLMQKIMVAILILAVFAVATYSITSLSTDSSTPSDYITAILLQNSTSTVVETVNMTVVQGDSAYIVLQSNLSCTAKFGCYFEVSSPFALVPAPQPVNNPNSEYEMVTPIGGYANYLVGINIRQEFGGNILLWIQASDASYDGSLTITVTNSFISSNAL